jgi:D-glycero-alpha-D-manno-heptose 1-phosphate guanylyltransferase
MKTREAIVLAGGLGSRLKDVLPGIPKCMAPLNGKPFLAYVLANLEKQGVNKVILSVGYLKDHIINYFGKKFQNISIEYAIETEPLGTGGAIRFALLQCSSDEVFILNGDTFFTVDLIALEQSHFQSGADITIAVKEVDNASRYGSVELDGSGRITAFREKNPSQGSGLINGGIYLINKQLLLNVTKAKFSLENDFFKTGCSSVKIKAFKSEEFFLDMGIPEDYTRAQDILFQTDTQ